MEWLNNDIEGLNATNENLKRSVLSPDEKAYLDELDVNKQFELLQERLSELNETTGMSKEQILESLEPDVKETFLATEYEAFNKQIELPYADYQRIKEFSTDHQLKIEVKDGNIQLINKEGFRAVLLNPRLQTGEVLIGEHRFRKANQYSGLQRGEFRLPDYQIKDIYNVYGPNSKLVGSDKIVEIDGKQYVVPIREREIEIHGMTVRLYGDPDFSKHATDSIAIESDAVVRESSSHKKESIAILAQNYMEGKYPEGTFTPQQEKELKEIANGKKAETISGLTPHHNGYAAMEYVPRELHKKVTHLGGSWLMNEKNYFKGFEVKNIESIERAKFSSDQIEYVQEVFPLHNTDLLVSRIDELNNCKPPKAIDSDRGISEVLAPIKAEIDPLYLEAPQDFAQVEEISDIMMELEGLEHEDWKSLSFDERMAVLQRLENQIAAITHRPACTLVAENLGTGYMGHYTMGSDRITLNSDYVKSDSYSDYMETLDTLIHEGRHAYQDYNLHVRQVHPLQGNISGWSLNEFTYGYQDVKLCGFKAYELQPLETDARGFSIDVLKCYQEKMD